MKDMAAIANSIFSPELAARFDHLATIYPLKRSALVPMLLYAQDEVGFVSDAVVAELAERLDLTVLDVRNVLSYYSMLRTVPAGKYNVQVCTNISCMLRGGYEILDHCKAVLGIGHKQVTPDGLFSLEEVECIGACCWAPAMQVNYDFPRRPHPHQGRRYPRGLRRGSRKGREVAMPTLVSHPDEVKILSRRFGQGAANLDRYLELDGYQAVQRAIENGPEWVITEMKASGLRGRGGAGLSHRPSSGPSSLRFRPSPSTSSSTAMSPSPAPAKTTSSSAKIRTPSSKAP